MQREPTPLENLTPVHSPRTSGDIIQDIEMMRVTELKDHQMKVKETEADRALTKKSVGQGNLNIIAIQAMIVTIVSIVVDPVTPLRAVIVAFSAANILLQFVIFVLIVKQATMTEDRGKLRADTMSTLVTSLSGLCLIISTAVNVMTGYAGISTTGAPLNTGTPTVVVNGTG